MPGFRKHRLSDAIQQPPRTVGSKAGGKPAVTPETTSEQTREARESQDAANAPASSRDRMVDIGRGNQQAGRQGQ